MKNLIFLPIFLLLFCSHSYCQYDSFIKPGKKWYYKRFDGERWSPGGKDEILSKTKIYNGSNYNFLNVNSCYYTPDTMLVREHNKRVYIVGLGNSVFNGQERILYDFNLVKGDTFKFIAPEEKYNGEINDPVIKLNLVVDSTYFINNRKHIKLHYSSRKIGYNPYELWIEGIGNGVGWLSYNFSHLSFDPFESNCVLTQMCDNNSRILPQSGACNDSILEVSKINQIEFKIFPNPAKNSFSLKLLSTEKYQIIIYNNLGHVIEQMYLEGKNEYNISFNYPKGVYFIGAIKNNGIRFKSRFVVE